MSTLIASLGLGGLSAKERLQLIEEIWESLAANPEQIPLTDSQKQELDRRLAADLAAPNEGTPWEVVKARAEARLRR